MADAGISVVRIGEFAWSRLEPEPGTHEFGWLEKAMDVLGAAGLKVVLGTPTATPPKWLVDRMPDMIPVDRDGRPRGFGSRRHYCFSHQGYRGECARIVTELGKAFGNHEALIAWQTDNEYSCHDTTLSWSASARDGFREWLQRKYQSPDALNRAWGNVFWSMEYRDFSEVELPNLTVTEANPAHWMDFRRYSSEQVVTFNRLQAAILRKLSPGRDIIHNFMGRTLDFDHFEVGDDLDVASWDSYPLGFLEDRVDRDADHKKHYVRAGDPDFQAMHHDLYRATGRGRWWVMEQQPGPVNWAPHNPAPRKGMVALWAWEAFAHGAEVVSYFRWRQAPFAQEQMHSGLLAPDSEPAQGLIEASEVASALDEVGAMPKPGRAEVAIVFDYPSAWAWAIQPQGREFDYFALVFDFYRGLRRAGLTVDFVRADAPDLDGYRLALVPGLFAWNGKLTDALRRFQGLALIGPRSGSKTPDFAIPSSLPPSLPRDMLDVRIGHVESLRADCPVAIRDGGAFRFWFEHAQVQGEAGTLLETEAGDPALTGQGRLRYLCGWPDDALMDRLMVSLAREAGLAVTPMPDGVRMQRRGDLAFFVNYGADSAYLDRGSLPADLADAEFLFGGAILPPSGVAILRPARD